MSGRAAGAVYELVGVGHALVYRLLGVVHFAFGELIALARTRQDDQFVGNPDPVGRSEPRYVFVTGKRAATPRAAARPDDGSRPWWRKAAVFTLGIAALGCGAVVWSRA